jgi:PEP-CTERM motif
MKTVAGCFMALLALLTTSAAQGVAFYPISSITSSTAGTDFWSAGNLIQGPGVGFDANAPFSRSDPIGTGAEDWVTAQNNPDYFGVLPAPILTIDLGADRLLSEISVWGYLDSNNNGASAFSLRFATAADGLGGFGTSISYTPSISGLLNDSYVRQSFTLNPLTARYVEMTITDNFYDAANSTRGGDRVGLGEIAFQQVPEPTTLALLGLGLAGLAASRRRRQ